MALKAEWMLSVIVFYLEILCILGQHQNLVVKFDKSRVQYANEYSKTTLTCHIDGDVEALRNVYNKVQVVEIVKVLDGGVREEVITKGETVLSRGKYKIEIKFVHTLLVFFTILSVKTYHDGEFLCRLKDPDGAEHYDSVRLKVVSSSLVVTYNEPSVVYAKLYSRTSLRFSIYGNVKHLKKVYRTIQIVKFVDGAEEVLTEGKTVLSNWNNYQILIVWERYSVSRYDVIFMILSVQTNDYGEFLCKCQDLDGTVLKAGVRLQVVKTPEQFFCSKKFVYGEIQATCSAVSYPQGKCEIFFTEQMCVNGTCHGEKVAQKNLSSIIVYDVSQDEKGILTTTCSIKAPSYYAFQIMFAPDVPDPNGFTVFSERISSESSQAYISSFTANNEKSSILVDYGDVLRFSCKASGAIPTYIYIYFKHLDGSMKLLTNGSLTEHLEFKLDHVKLDDQGVYTCQPDYDSESSASINLNLKICCHPLWSIIVLSIFFSICVIIIGAVVCTILWVRKVMCMRVGINNRTLTAPLVPVSEDALAARDNGQDTHLQISPPPPPYDTVCQNNDMQDVFPPPYCDVVLPHGSHTDVLSSPGTQSNSPPPYSMHWKLSDR